jgi:hypothetical protein
LVFIPTCHQKDKGGKAKRRMNGKTLGEETTEPESRAKSNAVFGFNSSAEIRGVRG